MRRALLLAALGSSLLVACGESKPEAPSPGADAAAAAAGVPEPDMTDMEPQVERRVLETRAAVLREPDSAAAWGRFGMVAHAHGLWDEAATAYERAISLDPGDVRWHYFLGDVLSVEGAELDLAEQELRRALEIRPGYAPALLRLGNVLLTAGRPDQAAVELERALELEPTLRPARVALAQARLSLDELDAAQQLLEEVLAESPRHAQALTALGQVLMRQGRRDEAREIAGRARDAARYNLFSDPLMSEVDREGRSSVQIWERARAFLENGDDEQAARGLELVLEVQPDNPDVHQQLGVAYGNLGDPAKALQHLQRSVALEPDRLETRIQLATLLLELQRPGDAQTHLERALALSPDDPDAGWLLGKAQTLSGDPRSALATFGATRETAGEPPPWARNEWGRALAETGEVGEAMKHFEAVLAVEPDDPQALFYTGLVMEGLGETERALQHYCRSLSAAPGSPAAARLEALEHACPAPR